MFFQAGSGKTIPAPAFSFAASACSLLVPLRLCLHAFSIRHRVSEKGDTREARLVFALSRCMVIDLFACSLVFERQIGSLTLSLRRTCGSFLLP